MALAVQGSAGRADLWKDPKSGQYFVAFRKLAADGRTPVKDSRFVKTWPYYIDALRQAASWAEDGKLL